MDLDLQAAMLKDVGGMSALMLRIVCVLGQRGFICNMRLTNNQPRPKRCVNDRNITVCVASTSLMHDECLLIGSNKYLHASNPTTDAYQMRFSLLTLTHVDLPSR